MGFIDNKILYGIYSVIFIIVFLQVYKVFDFPKWIIKDKLRIKNEFIILAFIILTPFIVFILISFILEKTLSISNINNDVLNGLINGWTWSMVFNFKRYTEK